LFRVIPSRAQQQPDVLADLALIDHAQATLLVHRLDTEAGQQLANLFRIVAWSLREFDARLTILPMERANAKSLPAFHVLLSHCHACIVVRETHARASI